MGSMTPLSPSPCSKALGQGSGPLASIGWKGKSTEFLLDVVQMGLQRLLRPPVDIRRSVGRKKVGEEGERDVIRRGTEDSQHRLDQSEF